MISFLSLMVAALSVFFGPLISLRIAKRQIGTTGDLAKRQLDAAEQLAGKQMLASALTAEQQILLPMRQAWINNLRDLIAELASGASRYAALGFTERKDEDYQRLMFLEAKIQLMLNPGEEDHSRLEGLIRSMVEALDSKENGEFSRIRVEVIALSRKILKREWDRIKKPWVTTTTDTTVTVPCRNCGKILEVKGQHTKAINADSTEAAESTIVVQCPFCSTPNSIAWPEGCPFRVVSG